MSILVALDVDDVVNQRSDAVTEAAQIAGLHVRWNPNVVAP